MTAVSFDPEQVTRTFPEGTGRIELVAICEVPAGRIANAWFIQDVRTTDGLPD